MNDPDVKLDREILAKIHNQLKQQSDRMDCLDTKVDSVINSLIEHVKLCRENTRKMSDEIDMLTGLMSPLPRKVDYLMKRKEEEIDAAGYCVNPTPRFK